MLNIYRKIIEYLYLRLPDNIAFTDSMTGLLNRNWYEHIALTHTFKDYVYVTSIDIDNLKKVNDTYGHEFGDRMLISFSISLKLKFPETPIIHVGGDEFVLITKDDPTDVLIDMQRNLNFSAFRGCSIKSNFSFGTVLKAPDQCLKEALNKADIMMFSNKKRRKITR